jgi:hypothetical protein
MKVVKDITSIAVVMSVAGAICVASAEQQIRMIGFVVWVVSNSIWALYFYRTEQTNPLVLFLIYLGSSIWGITNNR